MSMMPSALKRTRKASVSRGSQNIFRSPWRKKGKNPLPPLSGASSRHKVPSVSSKVPLTIKKRMHSPLLSREPNKQGLPSLPCKARSPNEREALAALEQKEQALTNVVETQTHTFEENVHALQKALLEQKPLSEEKHRQDIARKTFWLAFWLVGAAMIFLVVAWLAALFPLSASNALLIEIFGGIATFISLLLAGLNFLLGMRGAKSS